MGARGDDVAAATPLVSVMLARFVFPENATELKIDVDFTALMMVGRDFSDVSPVDGSIIGSRKQKPAVAAHVPLVE